MGKNVPRSHHYVCEFLLKNFADHNGTLWIYDSKLAKCRAGNTRSAGFERDLYALTLKDKSRDFAALERALERQVDAPAAAAIRTLLKREMCSSSEWMNFLGFVSAQMVRTPAFFERLEAMEAPVMQEMLERMAKFEPKFREGVRESMMEEGATSEEVDRQLVAAATGRYKVSPGRDSIVADAVRLVPAIHSELQEMHWTVLAVPEGEPDLLIGDCPVMLTEPGPEEEHPRPIGIRNPDVELAMPLSRRMVAIARWTGIDSFGELGTGAAAIINARTMSYARRFVFAPHQSEALLSEIVNLRGTGPGIRVRRIQIGERLTILSEYR